MTSLSLFHRSRFHFFETLKNIAGHQFVESTLFMFSPGESSVEIYKLHHFSGLTQRGARDTKWNIKMYKAEKKCAAVQCGMICPLLLLPLQRHFVIVVTLSFCLPLSLSHTLTLSCMYYLLSHAQCTSNNKISHKYFFPFAKVLAFLFTSWYGGFIFFE